MTMPLVLCNEVLRDRPFAAQCARAAALGLDGLEVAPFTVGAHAGDWTDAAGARLAAVARTEGVSITSLHWLLVAPVGLSLSTPDAALHARTVDLLRRLVGFAAACGARVLVHGSPRQRSPAPGQSIADALARCRAGWAALADDAAAAGVTYCIEPLSPAETPVINTVAEAAAVVDAIGSPALRTMLDLSAAAQAEAEPAAALLARWVPSGHVAHVQLNDRNRRGPGQGETPIRPALQALRDAGYAGVLAIEPFDYWPDADACAAFCAGHVRGLLAGLQ